jgi:hypothetical protein
MSMLQVISACPCCMSRVHVNAALFQQNFAKISAKLTSFAISFRGNPTIRLNYLVSFFLAILAKFQRNKYFVISFQQNFPEISAKQTSFFPHFVSAKSRFGGTSTIRFKLFRFVSSSYFGEISAK